jgi:two-component system response regulator
MSTDAKVLLLIEDDPADKDVTLGALRRAHVGNRVVVARNGAEALDYLFGTGSHAGRDTQAMPELVLLDGALGQVDDLEVLQRLRADPRTATLPVVILTTGDEEEDRIRTRGLDAAFVRKPLDFAQFARAAAQQHASWLLLNPTPAGG